MKVNIVGQMGPKRRISLTYSLSSRLGTHTNHLCAGQALSILNLWTLASHTRKSTLKTCEKILGMVHVAMRWLLSLRCACRPLATAPLPRRYQFIDVGALRDEVSRHFRSPLG